MSQTKYTTWGPVRGQGPVRKSRSAAERDLARDQKGCRRQGGYSDRSIYQVSSDGYLMDEEGRPVWPASGRTNGAVRG